MKIERCGSCQHAFEVADDAVPEACPSCGARLVPATALPPTPKQPAGAPVAAHARSTAGKRRPGANRSLRLQDERRRDAGKTLMIAGLLWLLLSVPLLILLVPQALENASVFGLFEWTLLVIGVTLFLGFIGTVWKRRFMIPFVWIAVFTGIGTLIGLVSSWLFLLSHRDAFEAYR